MRRLPFIVAAAGAAATLAVFAVLVVAILPGGGGQPHRSATAPVCPQATGGRGFMGACLPHPPQGLTAPAPKAGTISYPDFSNNRPAYQMTRVRRAGHPAVYLKVNQGVGFTDRTFTPMRRAAQRAGLAVGGYDFVSDYNRAEANRFVSLLKRDGMTRKAARWLPPTLDIEYGHATRAGLQAMIGTVRAAFGRVNIYTGGWYWTAHLGCWWPKGVSGWLAGYPTAPRLCGMPAAAYTQHQYTDRGFNGLFASDMNRWLGTKTAWRAFINAPAAKPKPKRAVANTLPGHYPNYRYLGKAERARAGRLLAARRWTNAHRGFDRAHRAAASRARAQLQRTVQTLEHSDRSRYRRAARLACIRSILHAHWKRGR